MRIALLTQSIAPPLTGIGRYAFELATRLPAMDGIDRCEFLNDFRWTTPEAIAAVGAVQSGTSPQSSGASRFSALRQRVARSYLASKSYSFLAARCIDRNVDVRRPDLLHSPNFYAPQVTCPLVVTVHDLSVLDHPEWHPRARSKLLAIELSRLHERACRVIVDSQHAANRLTTLTQIPPDRVSVVYLAAGAQYLPKLVSSAGGRNAGMVAAFKSRLRLPDAFALCVSTLEPRKNLIRLLRAYRALDRALRSTIPLVLVGSRGWQDQEIVAEVARAEGEGWLRYLGYVSESDLPLLYASCTAFAYPSLYEGFGLPVLEAMQSGAPVITSNASSLPEVGGDAVIYCDALKEDSIQQALTAILRDANLRQDLSARGIAQSRRFSWHRTATETVRSYKLAISNG